MIQVVIANRQLAHDTGLEAVSRRFEAYENEAKWMMRVINESGTIIRAEELLAERREADSIEQSEIMRLQSELRDRRNRLDGTFIEYLDAVSIVRLVGSDRAQDLTDKNMAAIQALYDSANLGDDRFDARKLLRQATHELTQFVNVLRYELRDLGDLPPKDQVLPESVKGPPQLIPAPSLVPSRGSARLRVTFCGIESTDSGRSSGSLCSKPGMRVASSALSTQPPVPLPASSTTPNTPNA